MKNTQKIEDAIKYKFKNYDLLNFALTHTSYNNKESGQFERLEFLGDRVLGLVISDTLYKNYINENEGDLAKRLAVLVSGEILLQVSKELKIDKYIKVGPKVNFKGNNNKAILSDAMEALIGAIFLDSNYTTVKDFIENKWKNYILNYKKPPKDSKSLLQEWSAANNYGTPVYLDYQKSGKDHNPSFSVRLKLDRFSAVYGKGTSKKKAEMHAARKIMKIIDKENNINE